MQRIQQAEIAYREAFADFARKAQNVQALNEQSNVSSNHPEGALEAALLELESAHVEYNLRRDEWVQYLLPGGSLLALLPWLHHRYAQKHKTEPCEGC